MAKKIEDTKHSHEEIDDEKKWTSSLSHRKPPKKVQQIWFVYVIVLKHVMNGIEFYNAWHFARYIWVLFY